MKKSYNFLGFGTAILILLGIIWAAGAFKDSEDGTAGAPDQSVGGTLVAKEPSFDFGSISMSAGNVKHLFKVKNASASPVTIGKIYTSCMCTVAALEVRGEKFGPYGMPGHGLIPKIGEILKPGEEASVEVVFDPAAHGPAGVGKIQRVVTIENSGQTLELNFTAVVTP